MPNDTTSLPMTYKPQVVSTEYRHPQDENGKCIIKVYGTNIRGKKYVMRKYKQTCVNGCKS